MTTLESLAKRPLITLLDAAAVSWPEGARKPEPGSCGLASTARWEVRFSAYFFGLIFFIPLLGLAMEQQQEGIERVAAAI